MNKIHFWKLFRIENISITTMWFNIVPHMFKNESTTLGQQLNMIFILTYLIASQMHIKLFYGQVMIN